MNIDYRWFLFYTLYDSIPYLATVSYNFKHRFRESVIEEIFFWIIFEVEEQGDLKPIIVFIGVTHIKAKVNRNKQIKKAISGADIFYLINH